MRPGDYIGDLSSRLFLSVQFPPLIGLAAQVSIAVRLLNRSPTLCSVPRNDRGPGRRQDGQRMVRQTAARWCWTGHRNSKEGGWKGWLNLRRDNWQSAPHRLLLCSCIARQLIRLRRASRLGLRSCAWRLALVPVAELVFVRQASRLWLLACLQLPGLVSPPTAQAGLAPPQLPPQKNANVGLHCRASTA